MSVRGRVHEETVTSVISCLVHCDEEKVVPTDHGQQESCVCSSVQAKGQQSKGNLQPHFHGNLFIR